MHPRAVGCYSLVPSLDGTKFSLMLSGGLIGAPLIGSKEPRGSQTLPSSNDHDVLRFFFTPGRSVLPWPLISKSVLTWCPHLSVSYVLLDRDWHFPFRCPDMWSQLH